MSPAFGKAVFQRLGEPATHPALGFISAFILKYTAVLVCTKLSTDIYNW
jgi:hypothetical protein